MPGPVEAKALYSSATSYAPKCGKASSVRRHARLERQRGFPEKSLPSQSRLEISDRCTKNFGSIPTKIFCMSWTFHKTKLKRAFFRLLVQLRSLIFVVLSLMKKVIFSLTIKFVNSLTTSKNLLATCYHALPTLLPKHSWCPNSKLGDNFMDIM